MILNNKKIKSYVYDEDIYYLSRIEIKTDYRNQKIGTSVFKLINKTFEIYFKIAISCIILKAFPLEYNGKWSEDNTDLNEEIRKAVDRLFDFYKRAGFNKIDDKENYMIYY